MSRLGTRFDHPATEAVRAVDTALNALFEANLWSMPAGELCDVVIALERAGRRLDAARVAATAQAETARVAEHQGATSLPALLRARADVPPGLTRARLRLHTALRTRPTTAAAFRAGAISLHAATAVCTALDQLPAAVPAALYDRVEHLLVQVAEDDGTQAVAHHAAHITHRFAPDELARRETTDAARNRFTLRLRHDGGIAFTGALGAEAAAGVLPVLNAFAAPRPATDTTPDLRDTDQRYADAFTRICALAATTAPTVRGEPPHLAVTISLDALQDRLHASPGLLPTGAVLSAQAARRLACDAAIIPLILGSAGEPVDIGRATRTWPQPIRRAIEIRDRGCTMPGCDRPTAWCDIHHATHWADGGPTSVDNGVLLCARHHTIVHNDGWTIHLTNHQPWYTPPPWIDPSRTPRLHTRFTTYAADP
jgi:hypothetical protein